MRILGEFFTFLTNPIADLFDSENLQIKCSLFLALNMPTDTHLKC